MISLGPQQFDKTARSGFDETAKENGFKDDLFFVIARNGRKRTSNKYDLTTIEIFVPFYKSKIIMLRAIAEVYFCFAVIIVLHMIVFKNLGVIKRLAIISPPALSSLILVSAYCLRINRRYLIQRDIYNKAWLAKSSKFKILKYYILSICLKLGYKFASCIGFENEYDLNQQKLIFNDITGKAEVLTNWCQSSLDLIKKKTFNAKEKKVIYAGNVGVAQCPESILKFLQTVDELDIKIDFYGSGSHFSWLRERSNELNLKCHFREAISPDALERIVGNYSVGCYF